MRTVVEEPNYFYVRVISIKQINKLIKQFN